MTTAHEIQEAVSSAPEATGWQWLHSAAQMAAQQLAVARADAAGLAVSGRSARADPRQPALAAPAEQNWTCFPQVTMRTPGIEPASVSAARKFASQTMRQWGIGHREPDVAVVISEMLSNALRHGLAGLPAGTGRAAPYDDTATGDAATAAAAAGRPIRLGLLHAGHSVICAVADPSDELPVPREPQWLEESGRGLQVIASLSDQWGSCAAPWRPGKVVWATFSTAP